MKEIVKILDSQRFIIHIGYLEHFLAYKSSKVLINIGNIFNISLRNHLSEFFQSKEYRYVTNSMLDSYKLTFATFKFLISKNSSKEIQNLIL